VTVASTTGFQVGNTITIGDQARTITAFDATARTAVLDQPAATGVAVGASAGAPASLFCAAEPRGGPPDDEGGGELYLRRPALPVGDALHEQPASAIASISPRATVGDHRVAVALGALGVRHLAEADRVGLVVLDVRDPPVAQPGEVVDDQGGAGPDNPCRRAGW
jgi:hypothetical protein